MPEAMHGGCGRQGRANERGKSVRMLKAIQGPVREAKYMLEARQGGCPRQGIADAQARHSEYARQSRAVA